MSPRESEYLARLEKNPADTLSRYVLAKDYHDEGAHEQAVEQFREILRRKPDWMKCQIHLGQSLSALGRKDEARAALVEALRLAQVQHHEGPAGEIRELLAALP